MWEELRTESLPGYQSTIGSWLWAMEAARQRTLQMTVDLDQRTLGWEGPDAGENAIGSLLYHIALVEMSWIFYDILEQPFPADVQVDFPFEMSSEGRLTRVPNVDVADHRERLDRSRKVFLDVFRNMTLEEWNRLRSPKDVDYKVSPAWAVFHLVEHEAGHTAQIGAMKRRAARFFRDRT